MKRRLSVTSLLVLAVGVAGSGCSGPDGPVAGASEALDGKEQAYQARAAQGLAISPVPLNLAGLSEAEKARVGIGSYIVNAASDCAGCHSGAGFLAGGVPFFLDGAGHMVWTRNLTPDPATGMHLTLAQFKETIRTGRDFHPGSTVELIVMPWTTLRWSSDADLEALYAYLHAVPAIHNPVPPDNKNDLPLPAATPFPGHHYTDGDVVRPLEYDEQSFDPRRGLSISARPQPAGLDDDTLERYGTGSYIASAFSHCNDCHTHPDRTPDFARINTAAFLNGGTVFAVPPPFQAVFHQVRSMSANLKGPEHGFFAKPGATWETFRDIIKTGTHADAMPPRPLGYPMNLIAANLSKLLDDDLHGIYTWAKNLPPTPGPTDVETQGYARSCDNCFTGETCYPVTSECVGGPCGSDADCGACQTCGSGACQPPAPDSACLASAQ